VAVKNSVTSRERYCEFPVAQGLKTSATGSDRVQSVDAMAPPLSKKTHVPRPRDVPLDSGSTFHMKARKPGVQGDFLVNARMAIVLALEKGPKN
jgi:hypothetical protein